MNYLSVCSGIEAASVAWEHLGWKPLGFSETEKFPSAVLAHHYPNTPNFGDMNNHEQWKLRDDSVDVLVGGTPCQSFSQSGNRAGIIDPRGKLMLTYLRIIESRRPRWVLWENVFGVLSANGGRDFGAFISGLEFLGYEFAWRVLDAARVRTTKFPRALPQRRRRVFVVAADARRNHGTERRSASVLFESERLCWGVETGDSKEAEDAGTADATTHRVLENFQLHNCLGRNAINGSGRYTEPVVNGTIAARFGISRNNHDECTVDINSSRPRLLTPRECERLQGFPDDYTLVPWRGKLASDSVRYKAIGNSMAINCMDWLGSRINDYEMRNPR